MVPNYDIDESGHTIIRNATSREILITSNNAQIILGQVFLTSAYLFVDLDLKQFTLWRSNPTERENLIAVPGPSCRNVVSGSKRTFSRGAYVGITLSATILGCLLIGGFLYWKRYRVRRRAVQRQKVKASNENSRIDRRSIMIIGTISPNCRQTDSLHKKCHFLKIRRITCHHTNLRLLRKKCHSLKIRHVTCHPTSLRLLRAAEGILIVRL